MEQNRARPFFVYFALNMPHYPYQGDPKWLERFKDLPYPRNLYAAFVSTLDERIGAVLKKVDDLGLRERTIVVFQSDNGHSTEERAHFGGGSAGPYRGAKFSLFEGGIRLPAIISWPGQLPEGEVRDQVVHACDWMPTLAELGGVKLLDTDIDGKSLAPVIRSAAAPRRTTAALAVGGASGRNGPCARATGSSSATSATRASPVAGRVSPKPIRSCSCPTLPTTRARPGTTPPTIPTSSIVFAACTKSGSVAQAVARS